MAVTGQGGTRSDAACCLCAVLLLREAWGGRLAQLKQQELQEIADAREKAAEVRSLSRANFASRCTS